MSHTTLHPVTQVTPPKAERVLSLTDGARRWQICSLVTAVAFLHPVDSKNVREIYHDDVHHSTSVPLASARLQVTVDRCLPLRPSAGSQQRRLCRN